MRDIPSGTWLVVIVGATCAVAGLGMVISDWSRIASDLGYGIKTSVAAFTPLAALAWGVHLVRRGGSR